METQLPSVTIFTSENWDAEVGRCDRPVLVDFRSPWCRASVIQGSNLRRVAKDWGEKVKVGVLDVSEESAVAVTYHIHDLPALGLFQRGKLLKFYVGSERVETMKAHWLPTLIRVMSVEVAP